MGLGLIFFLFAAVLYVTGEALAIAFAVVIQILLVLTTVAWVKLIRRARGSLPVLEARVEGGVMTIRTRIRNGGFGERGMPRLVVVPDVRDLWLSEQNNDESLEILFGILPHRYWLVGEGLQHAFGSYSRLSREDLEPLVSALAELNVSLHLVLERTAEQGPIVMEPVATGSPQTVTLGLPDGVAMVGAYSQQVKTGWIPADQAYANGCALPASGHLPVTATFSVDRLEPAGWAQLPGLQLPAYADTLALSTRSGVAQALVQVPQGFSHAYVFRRVGATGTQIYIHLDGPPPSPA